MPTQAHPVAIAVPKQRDAIMAHLHEDTDALNRAIDDLERQAESFRKAVRLVGIPEERLEVKDAKGQTLGFTDPWLDQLHTPGNELALAAYQSLRERLQYRRVAKDLNQRALERLEALPG